MIDLHDVISISISTTDRHSVHFEGMDIPESNTCSAVLDALSGQLTQWWHVSIKKNIPTGSGLGGGSSNAATLLLALNQLESLNIGKEDMCSIGQSIGSDVPFFLYGGQAKVFGTGDCIQPNLSIIDSLYFVLILPNIHCSTAGVYGALDFRGVFDDLEQVKEANLSMIGYNRLQEAAFNVSPELGDLYRYLLNALTHQVAMSGSGSTLFVPCQSFDDQMRVFDIVNELLPHFDGSLLCVKTVLL